MGVGWSSYHIQCESSEPANDSILPPGVVLESNPRDVSDKEAKQDSAVDYSALPCPVRYEELMRESMMSLKPDVFEGFRFDFTKPLNNNFAVTHSCFMGNIDVPTNNQQSIKMPMGTYEFGANLVNNKAMMIGRILNDGRLTGRIKYDINDNIAVKLQTQLTQEKGYSQMMLDFDLKGKDWNGQLKLGNTAFYGVNYLQSVTPTLALGGEAFWLGQQRRSGVGFAFRKATDKYVATGQLATTGLLSLTYSHKVSDKVTLASDFMWNWNAREATASCGYDCFFRQSRLRGKVDTNGVVSAYLEERLNQTVQLLLSAEIDHSKKDYKFGFGMTIGE
uniref:Mitochondrial import receptor subunit TOM40 n=1 Tax=Tetraselmis sp. GSL018 TaxID=582737 RepID=A0A061SMQ7_9CHLO